MCPHQTHASERHTHLLSVDTAKLNFKLNGILKQPVPRSLKPKITKHKCRATHSQIFQPKHIKYQIRVHKWLRATLFNQEHPFISTCIWIKFKTKNKSIRLAKNQKHQPHSPNYFKTLHFHFYLKLPSSKEKIKKETNIQG